MINGTLIINFVEEQEELSLYIWTPKKLDVRRRQPAGARLAGLLVVVEVGDDAL